ncbi:MAG TPA: hypothetical protein VGI99_11545 [Gemmataceae bacterium]
MFEAQRILGDTRRSIIVQTRAGTPIANEITLDPIEKQIEAFHQLAGKHPGWEVRKPPVGGYNCAGHVWASRRTGLFDDLDAAALTILKEDGYRLLSETEEPQRGDLVLYWESLNPRRSLYHVGVVFELRPSLQLAGAAQEVSPRRIPWILSKLDAFSGEVLHNMNQVYFYPGAQYSVEHWTDRPHAKRANR